MIFGEYVNTMSEGSINEKEKREFHSKDKPREYRRGRQSFVVVKINN